MEREPPDRLIGGPPSVSHVTVESPKGYLPGPVFNQPGRISFRWGGSLRGFLGFYQHRTTYWTQLLLVVVVVVATAQQGDGRRDAGHQNRAQHHRRGVPGTEEDCACGAEGDDAYPQIDQQHHPAVGVTDLQQPVMQVHLVGAEGAAASAGAAHD